MCSPPSPEEIYRDFEQYWRWRAFWTPSQDPFATSPRGARRIAMTLFVGGPIVGYCSSDLGICEGFFRGLGGNLVELGRQNLQSSDVSPESARIFVANIRIEPWLVSPVGDRLAGLVDISQTNGVTKTLPSAAATGIIGAPTYVRSTAPPPPAIRLRPDRLVYHEYAVVFDPASLSVRLEKLTIPQCYAEVVRLARSAVRDQDRVGPCAPPRLLIPYSTGRSRKSTSYSNPEFVVRD